MSTDRPRPPSVERLLAAVRPQLTDGAAPDAVAAVARDVVAGSGRAWRPGRSPTALDDLAGTVRERLEGFTDPAESGLTTVLNATGVILHTNLGRAPWPKVAIEAATRAAGAYSLLEFDRAAGHRGPRFRAVEDHLIALTGAEDALVTVNNAAALVLAVGLAGKHGVAVSRGELVEIGGGVRIPEIVRRTGARLIEVGTTNRTRASDFEPPLADGRATVVLRVHPSNFAQTGLRRGAESGRARPARPRARRDRHRRPRERGPARDRGFRLPPRADAGRAPRRRRRPGHVQRRQAGRWAAGRADRRACRPHRADPEGPAGPRRSTREGDPGRARRDARALSGRSGDRPRSPSGG